jgi:hypothetical protein
MKLLLALLVLTLGLSTVALAEDHRLEPLAQPAPDSVPSEIATALAPTGLSVIRGEKRNVCNLWFSQAWDAKADFKPSDTVNYPFEVGQLIGVIEFKRTGADFRGQEIASGVYTLRYGLQPVDGNHVGTSLTRDFLVMSPADQDTSLAPVAEADLFELSRQASQSAHPAILTLLRPTEEGKSPELVHDEQHDLWSLRLVGKATSTEAPLPLQLVVVGRAAE